MLALKVVLALGSMLSQSVSAQWVVNGLCDGVLTDPRDYKPGNRVDVKRDAAFRNLGFQRRVDGSGGYTDISVHYTAGSVEGKIKYTIHIVNTLDETTTATLAFYPALNTQPQHLYNVVAGHYDEKTKCVELDAALSDHPITIQTESSSL